MSMRKALFYISLFLIIILGVDSCKKKYVPPTKKEMLTSTTWKLDKVVAGIIDITTSVPACVKDNIFTFVSNGTGTVNEGAIPCTPPTAPTFNWSFQNNETELNFSTTLIPGGSSTFTIVTLSQSSLVLAQQVTIPPLPLPVAATFTFIH